MDLRPIILVLVVALLVWIYFGFEVFLFLAILGIIIAAVVFIYILFYIEGKTQAFKKWKNKMWKKYKKIEARAFKWWDEL